MITVRAIAPWLSLFGAGLLAMQCLWLAHFAFLLNGIQLRPLLYLLFLLLPIAILGRGGWRAFAGDERGRRDMLTGGLMAIVYALALLYFGPLTSMATMFSVFFALVASASGLAGAFFMGRDEGGIGS